MEAERLLAPEDSPPLGRSRAGVLDLLRAARRPLTAREVARQLSLHPNTARFHLQALVQAGLAARATQSRDTPGRPQIGYQAAPQGPGGPRRYRLLAEMLTTLIAATTPQPGAAAEQAGREWGAYLAAQPPPFQRPTAPGAADALAATMAGLGFSPQTQPSHDGRRYQLRLRHCPFREIAEHHQDVICALHLGLIRGALAQMRAPLTAVGLDPFAEPTLCIAHLTTGDGPR